MILYGEKLLDIPSMEILQSDMITSIFKLAMPVEIIVVSQINFKYQVDP